MLPLLARTMIPRLSHIQRLVEQKIVSCRCIYSKGGSQKAGFGI